MLLVADNIRITNKKIESAVNELDPEPIQEMARRCEAAGADAMDINSGPLSREPVKQMTFLVEAVQAVSDLPILIDTANPRAMKAGLEANKKIAIINGFSLEPAKLEQMLPLAKRFETRIVGYLLYPNGHVPHDGSERLNVAVALYDAFRKAGLENEQLIIDPVVAPVMWQNGTVQNMDIISAIRTLPDLLGFHVSTIAGLSNMTSGQGDKEKKRLLESVYLPMLAASGLSMALLNMFHEKTVRIARACNALINQKIFSWEEL
jgi:5-methyltetrahydrofolate corrinoid/iron sulfur protein methyltransferase